MQISNFEFVPAALGGLLIGLAATLLMVATGRLAGVSGFVSQLLPPYEDSDWFRRLAFVAGLALAPWVYQVVIGTQIEIAQTSSTTVLVVAGFFVGLGTVLGSGCTSGHGVCGLARLSPRSIVATAVFMVAAVLTVFFARHVLGL